jgi:hypothetical protein
MGGNLIERHTVLADPWHWVAFKFALHFDWLNPCCSTIEVATNVLSKHNLKAKFFTLITGCTLRQQ